MVYESEIFLSTVTASQPSILETAVVFTLMCGGAAVILSQLVGIFRSGTYGASGYDRSWKDNPVHLVIDIAGLLLLFLALTFGAVVTGAALYHRLAYLLWSSP